MPSLIDPKNPLSKSAFAKKLQDKNVLTSVPMREFVKPDLLMGNWADFVKTANKYNDPGRFTAFISYEWTSIPNGRNMHRNIYFRDDTGPVVPFSSFDSYYLNDLWTYQEVQRNAGRENLAIPHNGNVSDGWMFSPYKFLGGPIDARYAERQARNEPLFEMIQTKGSSDTHPALLLNDEFADFEMFDNMINVGQPSQITNGFFRHTALVNL